MTSFHLVCPKHGDPLREGAGQLLADCGATYPVVGGVAIVVQGVEVEEQADPLDEAVVDQLIDAIYLHPSRRAELAEAFKHKFSFVEDWIQVEADQFLHRVAASHEGLRRAMKLDQEVQSPLAEANSSPGIKLSSFFNLSTLRPGTSFGINLRVENSGTSTLSSSGSSPVFLSYHWTGRDGVPREGKRTPLLDDLLPGRTISIPVFIDAPEQPGSYKLTVRALIEGVKWLDSAVEFDVKVGDGPSGVDEPRWTRTGRQFEYMDDHFEAVRLLGEWRDTLFNRPVSRVVELGGNANPMIDRFDAPEKINVDIDPYGMIVGNLLRQGSESSVKFVVADGMALPVLARSVDMLVMFATFHHFPDPTTLLARLSDFVSDDGLICLMCEPIGHVHRDTLDEEYRCEIRKGVNEQSFELWEYQQMFDAAKLEVVAAQIDVGSAKIALRPRR